MLIALSFAGAAQLTAQDAPEKAAPRAAFVETIPRADVSIEMVPVTIAADDAADNTLWVSSREITWNAYDAFVFELDKAFGDESSDADAVVRPSKPYGLADYGFGRNGYPVISVSHQGAEAFCTWLSELSGKRYRLPTEAEWDALAAVSGPEWLASERRRALREHAHLAPAARARTHPVGTLPADANGLHDLFGNVAEWCSDADGKPVLKGGSFQTDVDSFELNWRATPTPAWNQRDPQIPKSPWWLSDAPFAGFRIVCEAAPDAGADSASTDAEPQKPTDTRNANAPAGSRDATATEDTP
ncbi:MAG: hypothetical protein DHS20C15_27070 [Planctomycetota bacterium]|nr:MAG: hypothetical protein DHS20C15_27070 [Planctomycetota bacterium]